MRYYVSANTSCGLKDFTENNVFDAEKIISINSGNKNIVDSVISEFCKGLSEPFDEIIAPASKVLKSGIILKNRKLALVSNYSGTSNSLNVDSFFGFLHPLEKAMPPKMELAYKEAKKIHDDWEKIYISNMDFSRLDSFCENVISVLTESKSYIGHGKIYKRFFGTTTLSGATNFIDDITCDLSKRYFIKGRPGTGKSTFLKKLSNALTQKGFDIEQYYCSFDPDSLDMVVSRELCFCVFDSTAPHEKFPEREGDIILDFYKEAGLEGIDEKYNADLSSIKNNYNLKIKEGNDAFKEAMILENEENIKELAKLTKEDVLSVVRKIEF